MVCSLGLDSNCLITILGTIPRGLECQGVLAANVVGHSARDRVYVLEILGKERHAPGARCQILQCIASAARQPLIRQSDRVECLAFVGLQFPDRLLQRFAAHIVLPISYHKQDLLRKAGIVLQVDCTCHYGVIQSRASFS